MRIIVCLGCGEGSCLTAGGRFAADDDVVGALVVAAEADQLDFRLIAPYAGIAGGEFMELQRLVLIEEVGKVVGGAEGIKGLAVGLAGLDYKRRDYLVHL